MHQWSILFHGTRSGKWSVRRRRDDAPAADGGGSAPVVDAPVDPTPAPDATDAAHPVDPPAQDDFEAMWGDLKDETPVVDPAAPPAVPEEFQKVFGISDYVKEPAHLETAVKAAQEYWDVQTGKAPATTLLEGLRASNPQQYEKVILEQLVPYIEQVTGKKLGDAPAEDKPMTVAEYEQRRQQDAQRAQQEQQQAEQQRQENQTRYQAEQAGGKKLEEFIAAGNGIFESDVPSAVQAVASQFKKLGLDPSAVMKEVLSGDTKNLEKAYKAAEKAETLRVKTYADRIRARYTKLKGSVPSTGASTAAVPAGTADLTTKEGRAKWMAAEFAAGRGE